MIDQFANWRNHQWFFDADYCELESAPLLTSLIQKYGFFFDDVNAYIIQGKKQRVIIRFPHYNGRRMNPRISTEKPRARDKNQRVLFSEAQTP